jgi:hypothetical protein
MNDPIPANTHTLAAVTQILVDAHKLRQKATSFDEFFTALTLITNNLLVIFKREPAVERSVMASFLSSSLALHTRICMVMHILQSPFLLPRFVACDLLFLHVPLSHTHARLILCAGAISGLGP